MSTEITLKRYAIPPEIFYKTKDPWYGEMFLGKGPAISSPEPVPSLPIATWKKALGVAVGFSTIFAGGAVFLDNASSVIFPDHTALGIGSFDNWQLHVNLFPPQISPEELTVLIREDASDIFKAATKPFDSIFFIPPPLEAGSDNIITQTLPGKTAIYFDPVAKIIDHATNPEVLSDDVRKFAQDNPKEFNTLKERALKARGEQNVRDAMILRKYLDPKDTNKNKDLIDLTTQERATDILVQYYISVEDNPILLKKLQELTPSVVPVNRLLQRTMRSQDFIDGKIPVIIPITLTDTIFVPPENNYPFRGLAGDIKTGSPMIIVGFHSAEQANPQLMERDYENIVFAGIHENIHTLVQARSKSREHIVVASRDGHENFTDPKTEASHQAMTLIEWVGGRGVGIDRPEEIGWRNFFVADRLIRSGITPEQATLWLVQISIHGTGQNFMDLYNTARLSGDPDFNTLYSQETIIQSMMLGDTEDKMLAELSRLAGLPKPDRELSLSQTPFFEGPSLDGSIVPKVDISNGEIFLNSAALNFSPARWESKAFLRNHIETILKDLNNPAYDAESLTWLLRADRGFISKLNDEWRKSGSHYTITHDQFIDMLGRASPKALARWLEIEKGPIIELPLPSGKQLVLVSDPKSWESHTADCIAEATWFMPLLQTPNTLTRGPDGVYRGKVKVGRYYLDYQGTPINKCPEGATLVARVNGKNGVVVGYWR